VTSWSPPAEDICTVPCPVCPALGGALCDTPATGLLDWRDQDGNGAWTHGVHTQRYIAFCRSPDIDRVCAERIRRDHEEGTAVQRRLIAEHRAACDALGISAEQEQEMATIARVAMRARTAGRWIERVCTEAPPPGLTDPDVLADWYEERGFRALRACANEEWAE
jgi:hypothetical protein